MAAEVSERLAAQLAHARDHVPYYQTAIPASDITADNAYDVLRGLPVLRRDEVHANRVRLWSAVGDSAMWRSVRTTGVTGNPVEVAVDHMAQQAERDTLHRHITELVPSFGRTGYSVYHLTLHASARTRSAEASRPAPTRVVKWNLSKAWRLPDQRFQECLRELDGHVLTAMSSVMSALVDRVRDPGLIRPALVILSGEAVSSPVRARIADVFACPVTSMYTLAEMGIAGVECGTTGGYHASDDVVVELLDGRVTMTSLTNRAMPLIRYETGDLARWDDRPCGCPGAKPLLRLERTRSERVHARRDGRHIISIDIAKLLAQLNVRTVNLSQDEAGTVVVEYRNSMPLPDTAASAIAAAVRGMLGPSTVVNVRQQAASPGFERPDAVLAPHGPDTDGLAAWARTRLLEVPGVEAAVLTGSVLSPETFTRYSDIDLSVIVDDEEDPRWRSLAISMHRHITGLRVNVTTSSALADAPLVRARLLSEHHPILGDLSGIAWPKLEDLAGQARFWAQDAKAILWTQLTEPVSPAADPIRAAWLSARFALDALRYRYLCRGARTTVPEDMLVMAAAENAPTLTGIHTALDVATERRPPRPNETEQLLANALSTVEWTRRALPPYSTS